MRGKRWLATGMLTISLGLGYWALAQAPPGLLPPEAFARLVTEDAKFIQQTVAKDKIDKKTGRKVKAAAILIAQYAQNHMNQANAGEMATLRDLALSVIKAVEAENLAEARKHAAGLSPKPKVDSGAKTEKVPLNPHLELEFIMRVFSSERLGGFALERELEDLLEAKDPLPADKQQKALDLAYKAGMIAMLAQSHPPEKDEPAGKTRKAWHTFTEQMRTASFALAEAAKTKKDLGGAAAALSNVCARCHKVFRDPP